MSMTNDELDAEIKALAEHAGARLAQVLTHVEARIDGLVADKNELQMKVETLQSDVSDLFESVRLLRDEVL